MTFKEKERLIVYLMTKYTFLKANYNTEFYCLESDLVLLINYALRHLDEDSLRIINNDFIEIKKKYWWNEYYSRTTYYRLKNKAMMLFINCLHNRKMV